MSSIDNIFIQVRAHLQEQCIKLWEAPYYDEDVGSIEVSIDMLADRCSAELGIDLGACKCALNELQDHALRKLAARKEYIDTGLATFSVRCINNGSDSTSRVLEIKCALSDLGSDLQEQIAKKLEMSNFDASQVKCIGGGKVIFANKTLAAQGLKNSQLLMAFVGNGSNEKEAMYLRLRRIKKDVEAIVSSDQRLMEMEDQDGNPVFLPPEENRALLFALGYCEKARAAMRREHYDEALLLLLEADEKFNCCNSKFLESVDNYALVNLDIVWCYLCLKNVAQLPDAQRRLEICERSFRRSYGESYERVIALKGNACAERAIIMRLQLLQGVLLFHQNRRDEAYMRLMNASTALRELKVSDEHLQALVEMGYDIMDARLALRSCAGNVEQAVNFIYERKQKLRSARKQSEKERSLNRKLQMAAGGSGDSGNQNVNEETWVNPKSVCTLMDMGFECALAAEALRRSKNSLPGALDLLQSQTAELRASLPLVMNADDNFLTQLEQIGFDQNLARTALETTKNNLEQSIDFLVKLIGSEDKLRDTVQRLTTLCGGLGGNGDGGNGDDNIPTTSNGIQSSGSSTIASSATSQLIERVMSKAKDEIDSYKAYERFNEDIDRNEQGYLDLPLAQEAQILEEYMRLLEQ